MRKLNFLLSFLFSFNGMMYELILSQSLSAALGGTLFRYVTTVGIFTLCLGISSIAFEHFPEHRKQFRNLVPLNKFFIVFLLALPGYFYILEHNISSTILYHIPLVIIALITGLEIPYLFHNQSKTTKSQILGFDYGGMFLACLAFPLFFITTLGLLGTFFFVMILQLIVLLLIMKASRER